MTDMRRVTIALPDELDRRILKLKAEDRFVRCSYSEVVRKLSLHTASQRRQRPLACPGASCTT